jgi:hypothetical protein
VPDGAVTRDPPPLLQAAMASAAVATAAQAASVRHPRVVAVIARLPTIQRQK